jgi:hypothetical protein
MVGTQRRSSEWSCGESLELAARYVSGVRSAPTPAARVRAAASREGLSALRTTMRSLPDVHVSFSDSATGEEMREWFRPDRRLPFARAPIAVLELPGSQAEYLRGRARQALRTNLTRVAAEGLTCAPVEDEQELRRVAAALAARRGSTADFLVRPGLVPGPHRLFSAAHDVAGDPVALSHVVVDGTWAGLTMMVTAVDHEHAPLVRYALHAHLTGRLIDRGATALTVSGSMLLTSAGLRYFQRRTGFTPVHLRPEQAPNRRRRP